MSDQNNLLRNCVLFGRLLRELGVEVTPTQIVDLVASLSLIDIGSQEDFKNSAKSILINRYEHLALFEQAFRIFWQARAAQGNKPVELGELLQRRHSHQASAVGQDGLESAEPSEDSLLDKVLAYSYRESLRHKDFSTLSQAELALVKRMMHTIVWNAPPRRTRRVAAAPHGKELNIRQVLRRSLSYGGEYLYLAWRRPKRKQRPVVVLCDISGSMERYSRILLQFIYIVTRRLSRVESFVFSTRLTRITRQLQRRNLNQAMDEATRAVHDWGGGTRIGESIKRFNYDWGRRVLNQGAIVLIISDGWDRGDVELLEWEMARLHRSCSRLIWLNPLLGASDYQPLVRGIRAALPHVDHFLPVHNLASLEQLANVLRFDVLRPAPSGHLSG
jgi:uncharacterized protein